jgi:hypothetical protein
MAPIALTEGLPGIRGPMMFTPETTKPPCELVQVLLTRAHSWTPAEREMIASDVCRENDCFDYRYGHRSTAAQYLGGMFHRSLDGLAAWPALDPEAYREIGRHTAPRGHLGRDSKKPLKAIAAKQGSSVRKVAGS